MKDVKFKGKTITKILKILKSHENQNSKTVKMFSYFVNVIFIMDGRRF